MLKLNEIYFGDCIEGMKLIDNNSIDLCVTSPPYKNSDDYSESLIIDFCKLVFNKLKDNSLFYLNFGHLAEDKFRPYRVCQIAIECGFKLNDTIIWKKTQFSPINGKRRLNNLTEFIFVLYKKEMPILDRLSIGIPYKDKSNIGRYSDIDLRCGGNYWEFGYETINNKSQKLHNDRFPIELPVRCIKLSNIENNSIILDPFSGSGTTCLAAKKLNHNFIGFEKQEKYFNLSKERLI